ncbi:MULTISPECIES: hypothetical protein [Chryseobacterium]|uniref:Uncharacterized protein n=1 Tax=Chryseobacterium culicis TaxID=680127 RepID=A0A2S9CZH9_CHRCI|nr:MULTISPECIES: hypothetical protein [Chryseobacterium]MBP1163309.1 hypothetical protein [Chryseobacterium sp. PvR013]MDR4894646.1 hypothetical protein [Chryseobacterium sp. CFS7]PRB85928.1 hypothetical protein CQ022_06650 [Chryseobacterium culicis]PRB91681.1 hypothetical protein CQ033_00320 [Chryseobacterium culicis]
MKFLNLIFFFLFCTASAQNILPLDTLKLKEAKDMLADDYGNLYIYKNKDFSFTKYDSLGKQIGKMMLTVPYKVQNVQNPLNVPLFSENAQEMKFVDQNMNEIQRLDFKQKFGFIRMAYAEDLQQLWLLDDSTKRLIQYNFRNDTTINSYPFDISFEDLMDMLVYENKVYVLTRKHIRIYSLKFEKLFEAPLENGKRFRRENDVILVVATNFISQYVPEKGMETVFEDQEAQIVDKNILSYFAIKGNKLYLYSLEKVKKAKQQKQLEAQPEPLQQSTDKPVETTEEKPNENTVEKPSDNTLQKLIEDTSKVQTEAIEKLIN